MRPEKVIIQTEVPVRLSHRRRHVADGPGQWSGASALTLTRLPAADWSHMKSEYFNPVRRCSCLAEFSIRPLFEPRPSIFLDPVNATSSGPWTLFSVQCRGSCPVSNYGASSEPTQVTPAPPNSHRPAPPRRTQPRAPSPSTPVR